MSTLIKIKHGSGLPDLTNLNPNELGEPLWRTDTNTLYVRNAAGLPVSVVRAVEGCEIVTSAPQGATSGYTGSVRPSLVDYSPIGANGSNSVQINSANTQVSLNSAKKLALRERSPYSENAWSEIVKTEPRGTGTNQFYLTLSNGERIIIDLSLGNDRIKLNGVNGVLFWRPSAEGRSFTVNDLSMFSDKMTNSAIVYAVIIDVTDVCQSDHTLIVNNIKDEKITIGPVAFVKKDAEIETGIYSYTESAAVKSYSNIQCDIGSYYPIVIKSDWTYGSADVNKPDHIGSIAYNLKVRTGNNKKNLVFGDPYTNCPYPGTLMITVTENLGRMYSLTSTTDEGDEGDETGN